eukprot:CFRG7159T1
MVDFSEIESVQERLDQLGVTQPLPQDATAVVQQLLNIICDKTQALRDVEEQLTEVTNASNRAPELEVEIKLLRQENAFLGKEIVAIRERCQDDILEMESAGKDKEDVLLAMRVSVSKHKNILAESKRECQALRDRLAEVMSINMASTISTPNGTNFVTVGHYTQRVHIINGPDAEQSQPPQQSYEEESDQYPQTPHNLHTAFRRLQMRTPVGIGRGGGSAESGGVGVAGIQQRKKYEVMHDRLSDALEKLTNAKADLTKQKHVIETRELEIERLNGLIAETGLTMGFVSGDTTTKKIGVSSVVYNYILDENNDLHIAMDRIAEVQTEVMKDLATTMQSVQKLEASSHGDKRLPCSHKSHKHHPTDHIERLNKLVKQIMEHQDNIRKIIAEADTAVSPTPVVGKKSRSRRRYFWDSRDESSESFSESISDHGNYPRSAKNSTTKKQPKKTKYNNGGEARRTRTHKSDDQDSESDFDSEDTLDEENISEGEEGTSDHNENTTAVRMYLYELQQQNTKLQDMVYVLEVERDILINQLNARKEGNKIDQGLGNVEVEEDRGNTNITTCAPQREHEDGTHTGTLSENTQLKDSECIQCAKLQSELRASETVLKILEGERSALLQQIRETGKGHKIAQNVDEGRDTRNELPEEMSDGHSDMNMYELKNQAKLLSDEVQRLDQAVKQEANANATLMNSYRRLEEEKKMVQSQVSLAQEALQTVEKELERLKKAAMLTEEQRNSQAMDTFKRTIYELQQEIEVLKQTFAAKAKEQADMTKQHKVLQEKYRVAQDRIAALLVKLKAAEAKIDKMNIDEQSILHQIENLKSQLVLSNNLIYTLERSKYRDSNLSHGRERDEDSDQSDITLEAVSPTQTDGTKSSTHQDPNSNQQPSQSQPRAVTPRRTG